MNAAEYIGQVHLWVLPDLIVQGRHGKADMPKEGRPQVTRRADNAWVDAQAMDLGNG